MTPWRSALHCTATTSDRSPYTEAVSAFTSKRGSRKPGWQLFGFFFLTRIHTEGIMRKRDLCEVFRKRSPPVASFKDGAFSYFVWEREHGDLLLSSLHLWRRFDASPKHSITILSTYMYV